MVVELLLLLIISFSAVAFFYVVFEELAQYKKMLKLQVMLNKDSSETLLVKKEGNAKFGFFTWLEDKMLLANLKFLPCFLVFSTIIISLLIGQVFVMYLNHIAGYLLGFVVGIILVFSILNFMINSRSKEFNRALATSISVLVKMMKNGVGFEQALVKSIEVSSSKVLQDTFEVYFTEKNTTGEISAFKSMRKYIKSKELNIFAMSIIIGRKSGGKFSDTLEKVEQTINYRKKLQDKIDVLTREASIGSYIVAAIGVFLYFMLDFNFQGKIHIYFMTSEYGRWQLLGIGLWVILGLVVNKILTKVEK
jgi:tight adherence protein B